MKQFNISEDDYATYFNSTFDELTVVAPELNVRFVLNYSSLCQRYPEFKEQEKFIQSEIIRKYQEQKGE